MTENVHVKTYFVGKNSYFESGLGSIYLKFGMYQELIVFIDSNPNLGHVGKKIVSGDLIIGKICEFSKKYHFWQKKAQNI